MILLIFILLSCVNFQFDIKDKARPNKAELDACFNKILKAAPGNIEIILNHEPRCNLISSKSKAIFAAYRNGNSKVFEKTSRVANLFANRDERTIFHILIEDNRLDFIKLIGRKFIKENFRKLKKKVSNESYNLIEYSQQFKRDSIEEYLLKCIYNDIEIAIKEANVDEKNLDKIMELIEKIEFR